MKSRDLRHGSDEDRGREDGSEATISINGVDSTLEEGHDEKQPTNTVMRDGAMLDQEDVEPPTSACGRVPDQSAGVVGKIKRYERQTSLVAATESCEDPPNIRSLVDFIRSSIQPLPQSQPRQTAQRRIPGAFAEGPEAQQTALSLGNIALTSRHEADSYAQTGDGSIPALIQARAVPEEEQADRLAHAQPVSVSLSNLGSSNNGWLCLNGQQERSGRNHGSTAAVLCFLFCGMLMVGGILLSHREPEPLFQDGHNEKDQSMLTASDFLWNSLPESTKQSLSMELITEQAQISTIASTTNISTPQMLAFQWLVQDPDLWGYSSSRIYQRYALATLYYATNGRLWHKNTNWMSHYHNECNWHFAGEFAHGGLPVRADSPCDNSGILKRMWLPSNNLQGNLPTNELYGMLTNLESINFLDNPDLKGRGMTSQIGLLTDLNTISYSTCAVSGTVPSEIGLLTSLNIIYFAKVKDPAKPPAETFGQNGLIGETLPTELGMLTALKHLSLNNNNVTGSVPTEFGLLTNLELLLLQGNSLSGSIPSELGQTRLQYFYAYDNQLTSLLPSEVGQLKNITHLHLYHNQLHGTIPTSIGCLTSMKELILSGNRLKGNVPSELGNISTLRMLYLSQNPQLTGAFPAQLLNLSRLEALDLQETSIKVSEGGLRNNNIVPTNIISALNFSFWEYYYKCNRRFPCPN